MENSDIDFTGSEFDAQELAAALAAFNFPFFSLSSWHTTGPLVTRALLDTDINIRSGPVDANDVAAALNAEVGLEEDALPDDGTPTALPPGSPRL